MLTLRDRQELVGPYGMYIYMDGQAVQVLEQWCSSGDLAFVVATRGDLKYYLLASSQTAEKEILRRLQASRSGIIT